MLILNDILTGVSFLHKNNIMHRDLKPANVVLNEGNWKLCDYGTTKFYIRNNMSIKLNNHTL